METIDIFVDFKIDYFVQKNAGENYNVKENKAHELEQK